MIDPLAAAIDAVARGNLAAFPVVALAGLATSIGPCVAPRYIAIAALLPARRRHVTIATFVGGMIVAYAALGLGVGLLGTLVVHASALYAVLASVMVAFGANALLRRPSCAHPHAHPNARPLRWTGAFSLGAASAFVVSPCCTPVVAAVASVSALDANPASRIALLVAFAVGHSVPLFFAAPSSALVARIAPFRPSGPAPALISGTLMLALGCYYGLLV